MVCVYGVLCVCVLQDEARAQLSRVSQQVSALQAGQQRSDSELQLLQKRLLEQEEGERRRHHVFIHQSYVQYKGVFEPETS